MPNDNLRNMSTKQFIHSFKICLNALFNVALEQNSTLITNICLDLDQELSNQRISKQGRESDRTFIANFQHLTVFDT